MTVRWNVPTSARLHPRGAAPFLPPPLPPTLPSSPTRPNRTRERSTIGAEIYRRQAVRDGPVECAHARLHPRRAALPARPASPSSPSPPLHKPNPAAARTLVRAGAPAGAAGGGSRGRWRCVRRPPQSPWSLWWATGGNQPTPGSPPPPPARRRPRQRRLGAAPSCRRGRAPRGRGEPVRRTAAEKARTASPALCGAAVLPRDDEPVHGRGLLPGRASIFLPLRRRGSAPSGTLRTLAAKRDPRPDGSRQTRG